MKKKNIKVSNDFINSIIQKNNELTFKILFYCVLNGSIEKGQQLDEIVVDIKQLKKDLNIDFKNLNQNIKQIMKTIITMRNNRDITDMTLISKAEYIYSKQILKLSVFPVILNELKDLKNKFTIIDLKNLISLNNKHSIRFLTILENMNNFDYAKTKYYEKDELNELFNTKYKGLKEIERAIIKPIQEEMDQYSKLSFIYDLVYDLDTNKIGRKPLIGIKIYLKENKTRQLKMF